MDREQVFRLFAYIEEGEILFNFQRIRLMDGGLVKKGIREFDLFVFQEFLSRVI